MKYAKLNILGQTKECRVYTKDEMLKLIDTQKPYNEYVTHMLSYMVDDNCTEEEAIRLIEAAKADLQENLPNGEYLHDQFEDAYPYIPAIIACLAEFDQNQCFWDNVIEVYER